MKWLVALAFSVAAWSQAVVQIPVWAPEGRTLAAGSVSATVGGAKAEVVGVRGPSDDLMLLVVLDLTDDLAAVEQARSTLIRHLDGMATNQFVGVLSAQNGLRVLAEPTGDRKKASDAIRSQQVGGRAGLLETIEEAARIGTAVIGKAGVRLAILYVTDSDINNYREAFNNPTINNSDGGDVSRRVDSVIRERVSRMTASLTRAQAPVFISHLTYRNDQLNVAYQTGLIALAAATGGRAEISRSVAEIPSTVSHLLDQILSHYSVQVALPDPQAKKIDVVLESSGALDYRGSFALGN